MPSRFNSPRTWLIQPSLTPGAFSRIAATVNSSVSSESMNVTISALFEPLPLSVPARSSKSL